MTNNVDFDFHFEIALISKKFRDLKFISADLNSNNCYYSLRNKIQNVGNLKHSIHPQHKATRFSQPFPCLI